MPESGLSIQWKGFYSTAKDGVEGHKLQPYKFCNFVLKDCRITSAVPYNSKKVVDRLKSYLISASFSEYSENINI